MIIKYKDGYITGYEDDNNDTIRYKEEGAVEIFSKPECLIGIRARAFGDCRQLKKFEIPDGITEIGEEAFAGCFNLESVTLPRDLKTMKEGLFFHCAKLKKVDIPETVTEIEDSVFSHSGLKSIEILDSVEFLGKSVFKGCGGLSSVTLPNNISVLEEELFYGCIKLINVKIPKSVRVIGDDAFALTPFSEIDIPDSVIEIGSAAFFDCRELLRVTLSKNIKKIKEQAFERCSNLEEVTIPEGVEVIERRAFCYCSKLIINIPDNFSGLIGSYAFSRCKDINFKSYNVFKRLPYDSKITIGYKKVLDLYYQDKSFYSKGDMEDFVKFLLSMISDMKGIVEYIDNNKKVIDFIFEINEYTAVKGIRELISSMNKKNDTETVGFLLNYLHKKLESMGLTEAAFSHDELTLDDCTFEGLDKIDNNDNEDEKKQNL